MMSVFILLLLDALCGRNVHFAVTSALRTKEENDACKGAKNSAHLYGRAIDLKPLNNDVDTFARLLMQLSPDYDQIIIYRTFVHVGFADDMSVPRNMLLDYRKK